MNLDREYVKTLDTTLVPVLDEDENNPGRVRKTTPFTPDCRTVVLDPTDYWGETQTLLMTFLGEMDPANVTTETNGFVRVHTPKKVRSLWG